ncbi:MAG: NAD/NADP octopine/nopaline dehydrogenase family protein [Theionarchaea archaeon]|nr:NAD/NADP octopine/nopaline dehydrogenase family protein [Theionarchaea archaeon]MBU7001159.1 NAD/NADP octopine/nopaline dehydrogenase family protein [Theionarchaea archaeon]MBU7019938.1 NAD/NADP octopine/nopaline dehydrogenase family protein [Theionarchaea archaeon]MBU7034030.1 NAD/NADP octopine/nopaline dehydrogenase family protein [Theionarchaea archaeon]MBU7039565.1 NAD/NADP octopine/nopaline dehydrogenase family protein [Theionarchaea archaeon]
MNVAVLGAGNGGQALAGYLSVRGFSVNLFNRSEKRIEHIKNDMGIHLRGLFEEVAPLNVVTTDIKKALSNVDLVMVVVPAQAHRFIAEICAPHLEDGQVVVLNPGRTGGALEFKNALERKGFSRRIYIAETQTFLFVSRVVDNQARITGIKKSVPVAAFPASDTSRVISLLKKVHPSFEKAENVMETSLANIGAIFHPSTMILNMGRIESSQKFSYYFDGITPYVARFLERVDKERQRVAHAMGVSTLSARQWLRRVYNAQGETLFERIQDNGKYSGVGSPQTPVHRYIMEDIPTGLVPIASLGNYLGAPAPAIESVIGIATHLYGIDFGLEGRTVKSLGLEGMNSQQMIEYVTRGA